MDYAHPVTAGLPVPRSNVVAAHATLAVFGAVLTTVVGALSQLAAMFTQTDLGPTGQRLQRAEEVAYTTGVLALAGGRLVGAPALARGGGLLVAAALLTVGSLLAYRLARTHVAWTPMLRRYAVVAAALAVWAPAAAWTWLRDPLAREALFGGPPHLLFLGVVGFVVAGTLYHVVPFIVWVECYSDRLGYESVPMVDDLYDDRRARADLLALVAGTVGLLVGTVADLWPLTALGGALVAVGFGLFAATLAGVVRDHSPHGLAGLLGTQVPRRGGGAAEERDPQRQPR
jgi:hypothetical protein